VWLVPMLGLCSQVGNSYVQYADNACLPAGNWSSTAKYTRMTCDNTNYPRVVTLSYFSDVACTQRVSGETVSSVNWFEQNCVSQTLGNRMSVNCFPPGDTYLPGAAVITSYTSPTCQSPPLLRYGVSARCANGERYMCDSNSTGSSLFRYTYPGTFCDGDIFGKVEVAKVNRCTSSNFTTQCPVSCFGYDPNDARVCSGSKGVCNGFNQCTCISSAYSGAACNISKCFGLSTGQPGVCSGNGDCTNTDTCTCYPLWRGTNCELKNLTLAADQNFYVAVIVPGSIITTCVFCTLLLWTGCCLNATIKHARKPVHEIALTGEERSWKHSFASCHFCNLFYNVFAILAPSLALIGGSLLIYQLAAKDVSPSEMSRLQVPVGMMFGCGLAAMCCCLPCYWGLIGTSSTGQYLMNIKKGTGLASKVERLRATNPSIYCTGESWRYDTIYKTIYTDVYVGGRFSHTESRTVTEQVRVSTGTYIEYFEYSQCVDSSNDLNDSLDAHNLVKVSFTKSWYYGDTHTEKAWEYFQQDFKRRNDISTHFSMTSHFDIAGFESKVLAVSDASKLPLWFNSSTFYFTSCFCCCLWPWSCWLEQASVTSSYQVVKTIFA
jgi:hypothetical protein